jgi:hypothetical protein
MATAEQSMISQPIWQKRLQQAALLIVRVGLGYLFFTQLFWKMPPTFGCPEDFAFTTGTPGRPTARTSGLCDWIGVESVWADVDRLFFVANLDNSGAPEIALNLRFITSLNGSFIENVVKPNIRWFGFLIWGAEAFIFVSLFFGLFTRLGGLTAIGISAQLMIGLAGIRNPYEWEWAYNNMVILAIVVFAFSPGRILGLDALLYPRFKAMAESGSPVGRVLAWLTGG